MCSQLVIVIITCLLDCKFLVSFFEITAFLSRQKPDKDYAQSCLILYEFTHGTNSGSANFVFGGGRWSTVFGVGMKLILRYFNEQLM